MTAEPDLPITDAVPAPTKIEPGNLFLWNWRQMQVYAQACVAHATAARDAEIEALRTLAGCAYQMAGFHDAPVVWLDRLGQAANGDPLPDPYTISDELLPYQPDASSEIEALRAEVREAREFRDKMANSIGNDQLRRFIEKHGEPVPLTIRMQQAEARADNLRAEVERVTCELMDAITRADKLAEALRLALDSHGKTLLTDPPQDAWKVNRVEEIGRAALREQEEGHEQ